MRGKGGKMEKFFVFISIIIMEIFVSSVVRAEEQIFPLINLEKDCSEELDLVLSGEITPDYKNFLLLFLSETTIIITNGRSNNDELLLFPQKFFFLLSPYKRVGEGEFFILP
ncbi:MAG: hypothetical protein AAB526_00980 [Patescibacteria group bacterium]